MMGRGGAVYCMTEGRTCGVGGSLQPFPPLSDMMQEVIDSVRYNFGKLEYFRYFILTLSITDQISLLNHPAL